MTEDDLPALIELQQDGAVVALADVFPQDLYPFPRDTIAARWRTEIEDPLIRTYVAVDRNDRLIGFAATAGSELLHFGTAIHTWGDGTAAELLDVIVRLLQDHGGRPTLYVFADNGRGRCFYEKHGWLPTGATRAGDFPPFPVLLEYTLPPTEH